MSLIQKEVASQLNEKLDLYNLPLRAKYRLYQFSGLADNTLLTSNINPADIAGRQICIKGIKIVPYYQNASEDFFVTDGATTNKETIPANTRINRVFDIYDYGCQLTVLIDGSPSQIVPSEVLIAPPAGDGNVPLDLDIDNIFYLHGAQIHSLGMKLDAKIYQTLTPALTTVPPLVKIFLQCYLL